MTPKKTTKGSRKKAENSIYFSRSYRVVDPEEIAEVEKAYQKYVKGAHKGGKRRYRQDVNLWLGQTLPTDGSWYFIGATMSDGEASSMQTSLNKGAYGHVAGVCIEDPNMNAGANKRQRVHRIYGKRPENNA